MKVSEFDKLEDTLEEDEDESTIPPLVPTNVKEIDLTLEQQKARDGISSWFEAKDNKEEKPIYRLFGYAGTGKTTLIRYIIQALGISDKTVFGAYTGKAAMVMRKNGLPASTIHSLIYHPVPPNEKECNELFKRVQECSDLEEKKLLRRELEEKQKVHFDLRDIENSRLASAELLVLDECSMVNDEMLSDILSFKVPLLVLGDPGQLPPIDGAGALVREKPDNMLTEIHRQARGNPIIDFATRARNGIFIPLITLGNGENTSSHVKQSSLTNEQVKSYSQILCGKNATRTTLNRRMRDILGFSSLDRLYPVAGDKLICLKNDAQNGLFNGTLCEVLSVGALLDTSIELTILTEMNKTITVKALRAHFDAYDDKEALKNVKWWERSETNEFDYSYAITVHKSQGSQFEKVLLFDDGFLVWDRNERKKWLYTGITRAIDSITIASK